MPDLEYDGDMPIPFPDERAFAKLQSLTKLAFAFGCDCPPRVLSDILKALVPLTGLVELEVHLPEAGVVPAALAQLNRLQALVFSDISFAVLEAGCLDLPNLMSLEFQYCQFDGVEVLPGATALQNLTRIEFTGSPEGGPPFFDHQLTQLRLQRAVFETDEEYDDGACRWMSRLPAHMGTLKSTLVHLDFSNHCLKTFPVAVVQLAALEHLNASGNEFGELPAAITALSSLTELALGRAVSRDDPLQLHATRPLNVRALGDLSGFPALCKLSLDSCEVMICESVLGAVRHASLASLNFSGAHPARECAPVVLQLSHALRRLGRGGVIKLLDREYRTNFADHAATDVQGQAPFEKFKASMQADAG